MSTNSKRVSVFDRLGPGNDEGTSPHHRYASDKHGSSYVGGGQEKNRGHSYGSSGSSQPQHVHKEDRDDTASPASRERKGRHRNSLVDFSGTTEGEGTEEKRSSLNPPAGKSSRDTPEALKSAIGGKTSRGGMGSGESDFEESVEEGKRRKSHRSMGGIDHDPAPPPRSKHVASDALEDDPNNNRRSGRERNDKEPGRSDRPGSSGSGGGDGPSHKSSPDKTRSRREGNMAGVYDHKRRTCKEDDVRPEVVAGHKRKRDMQEDSGFTPDAKKIRHRDPSRESDHHHHHHTLPSSIKEAERYHYNPVPGSSSGSGKETDRHHGGGGSERKRRQESTTMLAESSRKRARRSQTPDPSVAGGREKASGMAKTHHRHGKETSKRTSVVEGASEHGRNEGGGGRSRSLDWEVVRNFTEKANAKLRRVRTGVLDQFKAGVVLGSIGVSALLAGPDYYQQVKQAILRDGGDDTHLREHVQQGEDDDHEVQLQEKEDDEGEEGEGGLATVARETRQLRVPEEADGGVNWDKVAGECLMSCRQALTASDDYAIRRLLRRDHRGFLAPSRPAPDTWTTDQYGLSLELYKSIPSKPSGKPALKLQPSRVGTLVITR